MGAPGIRGRRGDGSTSGPGKHGGVAAGIVLGVVTVWARRRQDQHLTHTSTGTGPGVLTDDGVLLHVETDGPREAPLTVVFSHGFSSDMSEYDAQRQFLRDDFRLVFFDQRGHGRSGWGSSRSATLSQLGADLERVLDEYAAGGPVVAVGHSLGGMALMALARSRPELFGSQVVAAALISTSAGPLRPGILPRVAGMLSGRALRAVLWLPWLIAPVTARVRPFGTRAGRQVLRHYLFGLDSPPGRLLTQVQRMWIGTSPAMAAAFYPGMLAHDTAPGLTVFSDIPSLVLTGEADATIPPWHSDRIASAIGNQARLVNVPRAGHMVNLTHADVVNDALRWLLAQALPGTASRAASAESSR